MTFTDRVATSTRLKRAGRALFRLSRCTRTSKILVSMIALSSPSGEQLRTFYRVERDTTLQKCFRFPNDLRNATNLLRAFDRLRNLPSVLYTC